VLAVGLGLAAPATRRQSRVADRTRPAGAPPARVGGRYWRRLARSGLHAADAAERRRPARPQRRRPLKLGAPKKVALGSAAPWARRQNLRRWGVASSWPRPPALGASGRHRQALASSAGLTERVEAVRPVLVAAGSAPAWSGAAAPRRGRAWLAVAPRLRWRARPRLAPPPMARLQRPARPPRSRLFPPAPGRRRQQRRGRAAPVCLRLPHPSRLRPFSGNAPFAALTGGRKEGMPATCPRSAL
jgi:hypothetical protein